MGWLTDYLEKLSLIDYAANRMKLAQKPSPSLLKPRAASAGHGFFPPFATKTSKWNGNSFPPPCVYIYTRTTKNVVHGNMEVESMKLQKLLCLCLALVLALGGAALAESVIGGADGPTSILVSSQALTPGERYVLIARNDEDGARSYALVGAGDGDGGHGTVRRRVRLERGASRRL